MTDYKMEAAKEALKFIEQGQNIGLGAGSSIAHLINLIAADTTLAESLTFVSSSFNTLSLLAERGFKIKSAAQTDYLDFYFDGCDQFDTELNALKSGGGIHLNEKILAFIAEEFILIGDAGKYVKRLNTTHPLVVEVIPNALIFVSNRLKKLFPEARVNTRISTQKDGAVVSDNGNLLIDIYFHELIQLDKLNIIIKMLPGVVEHSLFYRIASKAIIAGKDGVQILRPLYD